MPDTPLLCRIARHSLFPIGWGHTRCRRCNEVFAEWPQSTKRHRLLTKVREPHDA